MAKIQKNVTYGDQVVTVSAEPEEIEAGHELAAATGASFDGDGNARMPNPGHAAGRPRDPQFEQKLASLKMRVGASGVNPATVFNFLPFTLTVNSPMNAYRGGVPAVHGADRFASRTWDEVEIQVIDEGERGKTPQEFHPLQIARAFEHEYPAGGVVVLACRRGDVDQPENAKRLKEHEKKAIDYMRTMVAQGERLWNAPDRLQRQNVRTLHKQCAQRLFALGILKALPEFCSEKRELEDVQKPCGRCGKTPDNKHMVQCGCGYILDPADAYSKGVISEEDESLERLTRKQVEDLGISAYVAETVDEKPARIKVGLPKPVSMATQRAFDAEQAVGATR